MKKYLLIAGLTLGLSGIGAMAQTSTTPGVPTPNDQNYPNAQSTDNQSTSDRDQSRTYSDQQDQQQYPEASRHHDRDGNDTYNSQNGQYSDQNSQSDRSYQSSQGWGHDRDQQNNTYDHDRVNSDQNSEQGDQGWRRQDRNDQTWQNNNQYPQAGDRDHDRADQGYVGGDADRGQMAGGDLQSALQQSNLGNVSVRSNQSRIMLDGRVNSEREHREALRIAQSYANGRRVVDRLTVSDQGIDRDDHQR